MAPKKAGGSKATAAGSRGPAAAAGTRKKQRTKAGALPTGSAAAVLAPSMSDVLVADHRDTVALLRHFKEVAAGGDALMLEKLVDAIATTVRLHSQAEFDVLYPWIEENLGSQGGEIAQHSREVHQKIESDLMEALTKRKEGGKALDGLVTEVTTAFEAHLHEEEDEYLPLMMEKASEEELVNLATLFMEAKARAPLSPAAAMEGGGAGAGAEEAEEEEEEAVDEEAVDEEEAGEEEAGEEEADEEEEE